MVFALHRMRQEIRQVFGADDPMYPGGIRGFDPAEPFPAHAGVAVKYAHIRLAQPTGQSTYSIPLVVARGKHKCLQAKPAHPLNQTAAPARRWADNRYAVAPGEVAGQRQYMLPDTRRLLTIGKQTEV